MLSIRQISEAFQLGPLYFHSMGPFQGACPTGGPREIFPILYKAMSFGEINSGLIPGMLKTCMTLIYCNRKSDFPRYHNVSRVTQDAQYQPFWLL